MKPQPEQEYIRRIQTVYHHRKEVVKTNRASNANSAVLRCVDHMQHNHYGATVAEVFDEYSGVVHAVIKRNINAEITIVFQREVKEEY